MKSNISLQSGKEYSLSELFSGNNNKIVIPDLQRDYCWGDKAWNKDKNNYTELVSDFIKNLLSSFSDKSEDNKQEDLTLGLIYGYENPKYHIQLSDGQQRITTLFLLLGMLNRRVDNKFQEYLISDYELKDDDKEPYLQYAIRESTLYFLGDLVSEFFLKDHIKEIKDIKKQDWYFKEYNLDASIQSMISAMKTIEGLLNNITIDFKKFGDFIINNLKMIYYDMGNRTRGEETFVIINTTGEPLTATENLKPILIGNIKNEDERKKASNEWEEREEWFWQNRSNGEATSDNALNDFFVWYWQIRLLQERAWKNNKLDNLNPRELFTKKPKVSKENDENPQIERWEDSIKTETIHQYFNALKKLIELSKEGKTAKVFKTIQNGEISLDWFRGLNSDYKLNVILPLIVYLKEFKNPRYFYEFVRRIRKNIYDKKWEERKNNFVDWRYIIQIIEKFKEEEKVLKFKENFEKIGNIGLPKAKWFNEEEQIKDKLKIQHKELIEEWEDFEDFMGDLTPLFNVASNDAEIDTIETYFKTYKKIRIKNYNFSDNIYLQNIYRLYSYLEYGRFEHRSVGGYGYCMLIEYNDKDFLKPKFSEIWEKFNQNNEGEIIEFLKDKLIDYFNNNILESKSLDVKLEDLNSFGHYEKVRLWALLEFLFNDNKKLDFSNSISCFWENKQNLINKEEDNLDYQIGNMLLGTSYFNNKTGWVQYNKYPLMKSIKGNESLNVTEQTEKYKKLIHEFIQ